MNRAPQPGAMPKMPDPVRIPSADDPDLVAARKKKMLDEMSARQGAASTNLSGGASSQAYSRTTLG